VGSTVAARRAGTVAETRAVTATSAEATASISAGGGPTAGQLRTQRCAYRQHFHAADEQTAAEDIVHDGIAHRHVACAALA
jgi:hypothetical protein